MWPRRPLELINFAAVGALLLLAAVCAVKTGQPADWVGLLARLGAMLSGVLAMAWLARREDRSGNALGLLVNFYPLLLIPLVFGSMGRIIPVINPGDRDPALIALDRALLGVDATVWLERFAWPVLIDFFFVAYCTYYFISAAVVIPLWRRDPARAKALIFVLSLAFYLSYLGYFLVPAKGPRFALDAVQTIPLAQFVERPVAYAIYHILDYLENTKHDAFPSGHTMIAALCMYAAARWVRGWTYVLIPTGTLLIIATVFCRYHYLVDVLAGLALAALTWPLGFWLYRKLGGPPEAQRSSASD